MNIPAIPRYQAAAVAGSGPERPEMVRLVPALQEERKRAAIPAARHRGFAAMTAVRTPGRVEARKPCSRTAPAAGMT